MDYWNPMKWLTWDEVRVLYGPPDLSEIGFVEGFSFYSNGVRESPDVAELREGLEEVRDDGGRLAGLVPRGYQPSVLEVMRSVDLMMSMARR